MIFRATTANSGPPIVRIRAQSAISLGLGELWRYRELLWLLVTRDIKVRYKQTLLGPLWIVLIPLATSGLFSLIFGTLAGMEAGPTPYPLYVFSGVLLWTLFDRSLTASANSLQINQHLVTKVYFPRLLLPLAATLGGLLDFALGLVVLGAALAVAGIAVKWTIAMFPIYVVVTMVTGLACGIWLAAAGIRFRDVRFGATFIARFWMWLTPVAYSGQAVLESDAIPDLLLLLFRVNPAYQLVEGFRWSLFGHEPGVPSSWSAVSLTLILLLVLLGLFAFRRAEDTFADLV